jgi:hypothetical protein
MNRLAFGAIVAIFVVPLGSRLAGDGSLAWTMYSSQVTSRLRISVQERDGSQHVIAPSGLAHDAPPELSSALAGAESYRPDMPVAVRSHLGQIASHVCASRPVARVMIDLDERGSFGERTTHAEVTCAR